MKKHTRIRRLLFILMLFFIGCALYFIRFSRTGQTNNQGIGVGISFADTSDAWNTAALEDLLEAFSARGFSTDWRSANGSVTQQQKDIRELLEEHPEYLVVMPAKSIGLKDLLEKAAADTKIIIYHGQVTELDEKYIYLNVDENAYQQGTLCASYLGDFFQGQAGRILELQCSSGNSEISKRTTGFRNELCNYPGLEIENVLDNLEDRIDAYNAVAAYLTDKTRTVDAIFAHTDELGMGALTALETLDLSGSIPIISVGGIQDVIKAIRAGDYYGCIDVSPCIGEQLVQTLTERTGTATLCFELKGYTYENIKDAEGY